MKANIIWPPNGSLISIRNKIYFISGGWDRRIVTDEEGRLRFIEYLNWKSFKILYLNEKKNLQSPL
jgi:hypothetical protein